MMARANEGGSVLMLVPAAVLVLFVLGAITVDSAVLYMAERDLSSRTAAVANDIASSAVTMTDFYAQGEWRLDTAAADHYARASFADSERPSPYVAWSAEVTTDDRMVTVEATARVKLVFAPAVPGAASEATVSARSVATARGG